MRVDLIEAGSCLHPMGVVAPGSGNDWKPARFPSSVAVIEHPRAGVILFDTGYAPRFHDETRTFPFKLYAWLTPVQVSADETAVAQLAHRGIRAQDVSWIVLSHFHADHCGGLRDFPNARFRFIDESYRVVRELRGIAALRAGFLPGQLPEDFERRSAPIGWEDFRGYDSPLPGFPRGHDLLGDGQLIVIPLPGHARGHAGLLVRDGSKERFLVADAAWTERSITQNVMPSRVTQLVHDDFEEYRSTLGTLHRLNRERPDLDIIPCHCERHERCAPSSS